MHSWSDFYVATAGASAALTGLIFVGVSISLHKILAASALPSRALVSLTLLMTILIMSVLLLIPDQSISSAGTEVLMLGIVIWVSILRLDISIYRQTLLPYRKQQYLSFVLDQFALVPYIIAGMILLAGGESGPYWIVPAIAFSFIKAVLDAWVLLIEINR